MIREGERKVLREEKIKVIQRRHKRRKNVCFDKCKMFMQQMARG
jgi:hypothetical protein